MFEWLIPLLILIVILIKIFDYLDLLDVVTDALRLVLAAIVGTAKLAAFLIRKLVAAAKPQP
jgi:nucleoside permease NupC